MKKIKVRVKAEQRVKYSKVIELTEAEFESLKASTEEQDGLEEWLSGIFDSDDVDDAHELEDAEFEVVGPEKKKRKAVA